MIQVCDLSFANSSITDTLGNYSLVSSGTVTISGVTYPTNTDPILYVTDSSYSCIEFGQTATYSNGAIIQAGVPTYGSKNWSVEFRARVTGAMPGYSGYYEIFYGCRAPYDDNGTPRRGGHWSIAINNDLDALEFGYEDHYDYLTIKDNLDFTSWHLYKVTKTAEEIITLHIDGVLVATIDFEQLIGHESYAVLGSFALLGIVYEFPTANRTQTNQAVRLADVKVYADPMGHAEKAISLDNLSRVFRNYNTWLGAQLSGQIGDGTLTIQQNGTTVDTFTANSSSDKTVNIQCVDLTSNQTVAGNKEFTGTTTAHDLVPSATDTYNFGSSTAQWNNAYIKSLTINGVVCGDILTHNASEFVDVSSNQTISGLKSFYDVGRYYIDLRTKSSNFLSFKALNIELDSETNLPTKGYTFTQNITSTNPGLYLGNYYSVTAQGLVGTDIRNYKYNSNKDWAGISIRYALNDETYIDIKSGRLTPNADNATVLGTVSNKWKDVNTYLVNGINPGALSLPSNSYINIDTTNWDLTCSNQGILAEYVVEQSGWIFLQITHASADIVDLWVITGSIGVNSKSTHNTLDNRNFNMISLPVVQGDILRICGNASQYVVGRVIDYARIYTGLGQA